MKTIQDVIERMRAEYLEMPGLRLTSEQAQRLCGIERTVCQLVLDGLITVNFLHRTAGGHYVRAMEGYVPRQHAAKVATGAHFKKAG